MLDDSGYLKREGFSDESKERIQQKQDNAITQKRIKSLCFKVLSKIIRLIKANWPIGLISLTDDCKNILKSDFIDNVNYVNNLTESLPIANCIPVVTFLLVFGDSLSPFTVAANK